MIENESGDIVALDNSTETTEAEVAVENPELETEAEVVDPEDQENKTEGEAKRKRPSGFQRKISRLEQENARLAAELEASKKTNPGSDQKPNIDNFETYDAYTEALTDWKIEQREKTREAEKTKIEEIKKKEVAEQTWQEKVDSLPEAYDDYEYVVGAAFNHLRLNDAVIEAAKEAGPEVIYHIAKDLDLVEEISSMSPAKAIREILRIEASLSKPSAPTVKVSKSSPPIKPVKGLARTVTDLSSLDTESYIAQRHAHLFKKK